MDDLGSYGTAVLSVVAKIEGAKTYAAATAEQMSEALSTLGAVAAGSDNDLIGETLSDTCRAIEVLGEVAQIQAAAIERLHGYLTAKGL